MKKHPIWEYLKQNDMTHMNESDFIMAYADPQKAKKIWSYLKENDMTHLDERGFYDAYFSTDSKYYQGLKKKEPSTQDLSQPQKPSGASSQPVSQPTATNDANRITDASKIRIQLKNEFNKFIKNSRGGVEGWDENAQNSNFELATQNKDQIISLANQLEALGYKQIADGFKGAIGNIYNIAGDLKGSWVYTAETFDQKAKENIEWFDGNMDWLNNTILQDSGVNTSPEAKVDLTSKGQKRKDNYYDQMMIEEKENAARLQEELRAKPDAILIPGGPIAREQEAEAQTNAAIASGDADVKPSRSVFDTNDSYSKKLAQLEEDLKKKKDVYFKDWDVYEREEKTLGDQQRLDDSYSILNDNLIKTGFASPETYVDDNGNTIVKDVKIDWNKLPNDEEFQLFFPDIPLEDKKMYEDRAMSPEMYARKGNNKYTEFENKVKNSILKQVQDYHAQNTMAVKSSDLVIQKLIDDNFNEDKFRAYLKKQEGTGTTILDIDRINKSVDEIASHYNLPSDGSVRRKLYHQAESRMRSLMLKDDADAFMELNNPELMQRLRDEKNKSPEAFQTTEEYLKVISEFKANSLAMANMYNSMAQEELDMLSNDFKSRMENVNNKYVPQMDKLKQTMTNLQSARQANRVSELDYGSQMIQLEKAYTDLYNQYTAEFPSQEEFLKAQNMTMNAFSVKSQKEYDMMMDGLNKQIDQLFENYTTLDPTLKAELEAAMNSAYNDAASLSQSEMVRRFSFNENTNWAHSTLWTYLKGGFSNFLKGVGEYYQSDAMTRWGQFMAEEATRPAPKIESFTDLLDFDNFTALLGEAGGTTIPSLAVSAGITIASEGVGAPAALTFLTTTLAGTALGIAQQAGSVQYDAYERTGSVSEALKAADEATKAEMEMWWLHMTDALPFMKGFGGLVKTPRYVSIITKPAIELASETVGETLQSNYELNISEGRDRWDNRVVWEKEPGQEGNVVSIKENLIFSAPMSLIGGVGDLFSKEDLSKEQQDRIKYVSDMTKQIVGGVVDDQQRQYYQGLVDRGEFARAQTTLAGLYMTGQIDLEEFSKVESYVAQAQKIKETADKAKLKGVDRDVYSFFTARSEEAKRMAEKSANDPVMSKVYEMQSKDYAQSAADFLIDRKVPTMYTVEHMDGTRVMMTDSDLRNAMNDDGFMTMVAADKIAVTAYGDGSTSTMDLFKEKGKVYDEKVDEIRELPVLEDKRAQYVSSRVGRLVSSEDISRDEAVKLATQEWLQTEDGIRYTNLTDKYDTKNKQGLPSEEQQGQKPIETKPIEGAGTEEAPAGGVVQGAQEQVTTEPQAKTEVAPETKLGPPEDWRERILATKTGLELYNTVKEIANEDAFGDPYIKSVLLSVGGARQGRELLIKKLEDKFSREAAEAAAAAEPQAETEVAPAAEPQIETAPNPELVKKGRSLGLTEAQIKMMPAEDRELIATATSKEDVKPLIEKYSKPKTAPKTTEVTPQPVEVTTTEIKPQVKPKQEQKIPSSQLEATFPEPLERNDDNINKLIEKKNKYNSLPKSKKSYGANLLNQIKQDARDMDLEVITTGGLNIKLIDKKSGKTVNKKGVNRAANKEFNSKRKIALSMGDTGELGIRGLALSYFVGGGSVREGQSELGKDSKEMKSAKKRGLVSEKAYSIDSIALAIAQELYGDSENAPVDAIDDIIAELQDALLTYETTADMEYDLVEMYDKAMEAQRDAAEYSSMQQANEALDNFEMSEDDLALYYESLPKLTQDEYEDYYRQNYPEAFEQEAESTDSLGGTEGQAREKQEVDKRSKRREKLSGLFEEAEKNAEMIRQGLSDAGIDVQVVSPEEMDKLQDDKGQKFKEVADGIFFSDEGKIYLRNDKASDPQLGKGLAFHEGIHPIINIIRNTNPKLYKALVDGLNKLAQTNEGVSDAKDWADQYDPESREDEFVTESIARIASGEIDPISIPRDLMQRIIDFLNKISQALFGKSPLTYRSSEKEVQKLASQITDLFNGYGRLSDIVGAENVKKFANVTYIDSNGNEVTADQAKYRLSDEITDPKTGFIFEYAADGKEFEKLKKKGLITENKTLNDFVGKYIYGHSPDAAFTGNIKKKDENGKEITVVEGKGGVFYPIKFIKKLFVWASTSSAANSMAKQLNENAKKNGGPIYLALVSAPEDKLLSSTTSSNGVIDIFKAMSNDVSGFGIPKNVFKNALLKAAKAKQINAQGKTVGLNLKNLTQANTVEEIEAQVRESLAADASIFDDRKTFSLAFIKAFAAAISGTKSEQKVGKFLVQGVEVKGYKQQGKIGEPGKERYKLSPANMISAISQMMAEPMLRGESSKKIYAIIEITPNPKGVDSPSVTSFDSDLHESYPKAIKLTNDAMKVKVHILQDRELWTDRLEDPETGGLVAPDREKKLFPTSGVTTTSLKVLPKKPKGQPSLEGARQNVQRSIPRRRLPSNTEIVNGFYSPIERNLRETKAEKQSANKWLSGGIIGKGDEAVYTGVRQWLESKNPQEQVSKQEILDWMKNNRVEIKEVVKGVEDFTDESRWKKRASGDGVWETTASDGTKLTIDASEGEGTLYIYADGNEIGSEDYSPGDDLFDLGIQAIMSSMDYSESPTKYHQYQLEGEKENYKEVLVTLPVTESQKSEIDRIALEAKSAEELADNMFNKANISFSQDALENGYSNEKDKPFIAQQALALAVYQGDSYGRKQLEDRLRYFVGDENFERAKKLGSDVNEAYKNAQKKKSETPKGVFKSTHFDEPNILVHLRMNARTDADGNKVLFLEEVQSDWGQEGKKYGFKKEISEKDIDAKFFQSEVPKGADPKNYPGYWESYDKRTGEMIVRHPGSYTKEQVIKEALSGYEVYINQKSKPSAPFVTDTNAWTKLGLKMALREAVAQGADKIAWTTGEQQNERYDLSKQVKQVEWNKYTERGAVKLVTITPITGNPIELPIDENGIVSKNAGTQFDGQRIDNVIGKEIGDKIISESNGDLSGIRLKVGGKGMRGFYDKIVPDVAKSLVKELTGEKVELGTTQLEGVESTQQSIEITPELRESIQEGMPQFAQGRAGGVSQDTILDAMDAVDQAIESGVDADTAIQENIISQPWYGSLSDAQKAKVDETIESEYGVSPSQIVVANESAKQIEDLYNSKEKSYKNKIQDLLADDEELKYIYNNIPRILGALEQEGIIKKNINCP